VRTCDRSNARTALAATALALLACACGEAQPAAPAGIDPRRMADALHAVMESDRIVYTKKVVNRLQNDLGIITASEHWEDDKALPLPAQMFRMGSELAAAKDLGFTYALLSLWPVNKQNAPRTEVEKAGLQYVIDNPGQNYYADEELGGQKYLTAVYADVAVAPACVSCHNGHVDSPRKDFELNDVMGGVVVRIRNGAE
jgi:hypothetical protein